MTATIYILDTYRGVPSVIAQRKSIAWRARQKVTFEYAGIPPEILEIACTEAANFVFDGGGLDAAMDAARIVVEKYWEYSKYADNTGKR